MSIRLDTLAYFYKIESVQDEESGKRVKQIISKKEIYVSLQEVGLETYYQAYANNSKLVKTIEMRKMSYNREQYIGIKKPFDPNNWNDFEVFQVDRVAKGKTIQFIKLPLKESVDQEVIDLIGYDLFGSNYQ